MAKQDGLKLSELNASLRSGKMDMNPDIVAQINKALEENVDAIKTEVSSETSLTKSINKLIKSIEKNTSAMADLAKKIVMPKVKSDLTEADIEQGIVNNQMINLLSIIAQNTMPIEEECECEEEEVNLGKWALIIAGLLGAVAGLFKAWYTGVKAILGGIFTAFKNLSKFIFNLLPESWKAGIRNNIAKISTFFSDMVTKLGIAIEYGVNIVRDFFKNKILTLLITAKNAIMTSLQPVIKAFNSFASMFTGAGRFASASTKVVAGIKDFFVAIQKLGSMVATGVKAIGNIAWVGEKIASISKWFGNIVSWVSKFGGFISETAGFFSKLALPLNIIMGLYGGISKSFDKFAKGDLIGGIIEFSSGALEVVVGGFFDAVKSIVSWIFGAIGLDSVEKFLDSFSFTGIIEGLFDYIEKFFKALYHPIDTITSAFNWVTEQVSGLFEGFELPDMIKDLAQTLFHPFDTFKKLFTGLFDWFEEFEIPGIGFSVMGKKFQFGPWYPFKSDDKGSENKVDEGGDKEEKSESTSGELKGVTGEQVKSHPNYKKHYDQAIKEGASPIEAAQDASMEVKSDMVKEQNAPKSKADIKAETDKKVAGLKSKEDIKAETDKKVSDLKAGKKEEDKSIFSSAIDWFTGAKPEGGLAAQNDKLFSDTSNYMPVGQQVTTPAPTAANKIYGDSAKIAAADKQVPITKSTNVVNAPTQINNQTQNAMFKKPVRNEDNTLSGWLKTKFS